MKRFKVIWPYRTSSTVPFTAMSEQVSNSHISRERDPNTPQHSFTTSTRYLPNFGMNRGSFKDPNPHSATSSPANPALASSLKSAVIISMYNMLALGVSTHPGQIQSILIRDTSSESHTHSPQAERSRGNFARDIRPLPTVADNFVALHQAG
jgi:hypothetical protein